MRMQMEAFEEAGATEEAIAEIANLVLELQAAEEAAAEARQKIEDAVPAELREADEHATANVAGLKDRFRELALGYFENGGVSVEVGELRVTLSKSEPQMSVEHKAVTDEWLEKLAGVEVDGSSVVRPMVDTGRLLSAVAAGAVDERELRRVGIVTMKQRMPSVRTARVKP